MSVSINTCNDDRHITSLADYSDSWYFLLKKVTPKALDAVPIRQHLNHCICDRTDSSGTSTGTAWGERGADEIAGLVSGGKYTPSGMTNDLNRQLCFLIILFRSFRIYSFGYCRRGFVTIIFKLFLLMKRKLILKKAA